MKNQTLKEELLISCFQALNEQGQAYILNTIDMVKEKYSKDMVCFPAWRKTEKEYVEELSYCTQNKLICLDFYRRNKDWKRKMRKWQEQKGMYDAEE